MIPPDLAITLVVGIPIIYWLIMKVNPNWHSHVNPKKRYKNIDFGRIFLEWQQKDLDTKIATEKAIKSEKLRKIQKKINAEAEKLKSNQKDLF